MSTNVRYESNYFFMKCNLGSLQHIEMFVKVAQGWDSEWKFKTKKMTEDRISVI